MSFHAAENHPIKYLAVYNDLKEAMVNTCAEVFCLLKWS